MLAKERNRRVILIDMFLLIATNVSQREVSKAVSSFVYEKVNGQLINISKTEEFKKVY